MISVGTVLEQLIERTKSGVIPWHEVGERGTTDVVRYTAVCGEVEFRLDLDPLELQINDVAIECSVLALLNELRVAIFEWLVEGEKKKDEREVQRALKMATKVLGQK